MHSLVCLLLYLKLSPLVPRVLGIDCCCSHPFFLGVRASAVFMWLPAVKHVAKVNPGGVTGSNKRGATEQEIHRLPSCRHLVPLLLSPATHFTACTSGTVEDVSSVLERRLSESRQQQNHRAECQFVGLLWNVWFYNPDANAVEEESRSISETQKQKR